MQQQEQKAESGRHVRGRTSKADTFKSQQPQQKQQQTLQPHKLHNVANRYESETMNALERIIKLDRKNANFDINDTKQKKRLKIRNITNQPAQVLTGNQTEHLLRLFWRHISSFYFRKMEASELERLDYLCLTMLQKIKDVKCKYNNYQNYWTITDILNVQYKTQTGKLNYQNLLKHLRIAFYIHSAPDKEAKLLQRQKEKIHRTFTLDDKGLRVFNQQQEATHLDTLIGKIEEQDERVDYISQEIERLKTQLKDITDENQQNLKKVMERANLELTVGCPVFCESVDKTAQQIQIEEQLESTVNIAIYRHQQVSSPASFNVQQDQLLKMIRRLEDKQVAESIACIIGSEKDGLTKTVLYEVLFEESVNRNQVYMDEEELKFYNNFREWTLFQCYNVPSKTYTSHIAQNHYGFSHIMNHRNRHNSLVRRELLGEMRRHNFRDARMREFTICHHCKQFLNEKSLLPCQYRSSRMGLPVLNSTVQDSFLNSQMEMQGNAKKPKRAGTDQYMMVAGELVCLRRYCRACLKQNYDVTLNESENFSDFICPFCQGTCFCTRCLRNDMIMKLKGMLLLTGGDLTELHRLSKSGTYLRPQQAEEQTRRYKEELHNIQTPNSRGHTRSYEKMCAIRIDLEKLRMLASVIMRREKIKMQVFKASTDLFRQKYVIISGAETYREYTSEEVVQIEKRSNQNLQSDNNIDTKWRKRLKNNEGEAVRVARLDAHQEDQDLHKGEKKKKFSQKNRNPPRLLNLQQLDSSQSQQYDSSENVQEVQKKREKSSKLHGTAKNNDNKPNKEKFVAQLVLPAVPNQRAQVQNGHHSAATATHRFEEQKQSKGGQKNSPEKMHSEVVAAHTNGQLAGEQQKPTANPLRLKGEVKHNEKFKKGSLQLQPNTHSENELKVPFKQKSTLKRANPYSELNGHQVLPAGTAEASPQHSFRTSESDNALQLNGRTARSSVIKGMKLLRKRDFLSFKDQLVPAKWLSAEDRKNMYQKQ